MGQWDDGRLCPWEECDRRMPRDRPTMGDIRMMDIRRGIVERVGDTLLSVALVATMQPVDNNGGSNSLCDTYVFMTE